MLLDFLQTLKSSEESLREHLEKAKKKEAAFIVTFAKREQEIAELKSLQFRDLNEKRNIRLEVEKNSKNPILISGCKVADGSGVMLVMFYFLLPCVCVSIY
ncbi:hypothetical protein AHAS_AhasUnG0050000 [Arachis hypogaea]